MESGENSVPARNKISRRDSTKVDIKVVVSINFYREERRCSDIEHDSCTFWTF